MSGKLAAQEEESLGKEIFAAYRVELRRQRCDGYALNHKWPEMIAWLEARAERKAHELAVADASSPRQTIEQNVSVDISLAVSQAFDVIDGCGLSDADANEGKALLADAQNERDPERRSAKIVRAVEWAADKGPKLVDAVMKVGGALAQLPPLG